MALTNLEKVRIEIGDSAGAGLYILDDDSIEYFLSKNNQNITRASLDAAKTVLFNLAQRGEETVDIFTIKGSKASAEYREALKLFIKDSNLNPLLRNAQGWFGGVSLAEMQANRDNLDNNIVTTAASTDILTNPTVTYF
jgi:hypothetical protein